MGDASGDVADSADDAAASGDAAAGEGAEGTTFDADPADEPASTAAPAGETDGSVPVAEGDETGRNLLAYSFMALAGLVAAVCIYRRKEEE